MLSTGPPAKASAFASAPLDDARGRLPFANGVVALGTFAAVEGRERLDL